MKDQPVLSLREVGKTYSRKRILSGVHLDVFPGERVAVLGPNGVGKSTLFKIVGGIVAPDEGTVHCEGGRRPVVGFLPERIAFYPRQTAIETLRFFARLRGLPAAEAGRALEKCGLGWVARVPVGVLSRGSLQRLGLAQAFLGRPPLILLDEPTVGLDGQGMAWFRRTLLDLASAGSAILFSSHSLAEARELGSRVLVIRGGKLLVPGFKDGATAAAGWEWALRVALGGARPLESLALDLRTAGAATVEIRNAELFAAGPPASKERILRVLGAAGPFLDLEIHDRLADMPIREEPGRTGQPAAGEVSP